MRHVRTLWITILLAAAIPQAAAQTDPKTAEEFDRFRAIMEEANPAELFEVKGEALWKKKRGPKNASLEQCDLGLGAGVVKGAYVQMPRYFADTDKVMDAEQRVVHCMITLQGFKYADLAKKPFSSANRTPDPVSIVTYIAAQSKGMKIDVPQNHPKERKAYEVGRETFFYRAGPYDFSCASCHGQDDLRIRTQPLPNFTKADDAPRSFLGWPGYRMTGGVMHTLQWRLTDCFRQQRFPYLRYVSDTATALLTYLGVNANGAVYGGPGMKR